MTAVTVTARRRVGSSTQGRAALGGVERAAAGAVVALVVLLGVIGAVNSFRAVAEAVEPSFGGLAWTVPIGVDVGIAVFTALDLLLARVGMRMSWLRLVPWALVATTIYLNVAGEEESVAAVAHGVLPALWVIAVEAGSHVVRSHVGLTSSSGVERMDRVRWSRWVLAPARRCGCGGGWCCGRRVATPRRCGGSGTGCWRARTCRTAGVGGLAVAGAPPGAGAVSARRVGPGGSARVGRSRKRLVGYVQAGEARQPRSIDIEAEAPRPTVDVEDLIATGRAVAGELARDGLALTRAALADRMRARGCLCRTPGWARCWPSSGAAQVPGPKGWRDGCEAVARMGTRSARPAAALGQGPCVVACGRLVQEMICRRSSGSTRTVRTAGRPSSRRPGDADGRCWRWSRTRARTVLRTATTRPRTVPRRPADRTDGPPAVDGPGPLGQPVRDAGPSAAGTRTGPEAVPPGESPSDGPHVVAGRWHPGGWRTRSRRLVGERRTGRMWWRSTGCGRRSMPSGP